MGTWGKLLPEVNPSHKKTSHPTKWIASVCRHKKTDHFIKMVGLFCFVGCSALQSGPVGTFFDCCPVFVAVGLAAVIVAVGGFLNRQVVPFVRICVVCPADHILGQISRGFGDSLQHTVDKRHRFRTGDALVGAEGTVLVAQDPTVVGGGVDLALRPMSVDIRERCAGAFGGGVKPGSDRGELGARDRVVRVESAVGASVEEDE